MKKTGAWRRPIVARESKPHASIGPMTGATVRATSFAGVNGASSATARTRAAHSQIHGGGGAQGLAVDGDLVRPIAGLQQVVIGRIGVAINTSFAGPPLAFSVAAVIQREDRESGCLDFVKLGVAVRDVARIAVEVQSYERGALTRNPPGMNADAILCVETSAACIGACASQSPSGYFAGK